MKPAALSMKKILNTEFKQPKYKIINNVTAKEETDVEIIKNLLIDQIFLQLDGEKRCNVFSRVLKNLFK